MLDVSAVQFGLSKTPRAWDTLAFKKEVLNAKNEGRPALSSREGQKVVRDLKTLIQNKLDQLELRQSKENSPVKLAKRAPVIVLLRNTLEALLPTSKKGQ